MAYILLLLIPVAGLSQKYADQEYYLIDSLVLEELTERDQKFLDSCLSVYHSSKDDTTGIIALGAICENMMHQDWMKYQFYQYHLIKEVYSSALPEQTKQSLTISLAEALNNLGYAYMSLGDIHKALDYYHKSLKLWRVIGDEKGIAGGLNNIGYLYDHHKGDIPNALKYFHESLVIRERINDRAGIANNLSNIAFIYANQGEVSKALEYFQKSLEIREELDDKDGIANNLNNIGFIYSSQKNYEEALHRYQKSLAIQETIGDKRGIANSLNNIGFMYYNQEGVDMALEYYQKSLDIWETIGDKHGITNSLNNIGVLKLELDLVGEAEKAGLRSLAVAQEIGYPDDVKAAAKLLSGVYEAQGKGVKALEMYRLYIQMKDSIHNAETQKATIRQQTQYEFEKAQIIKENEEKEARRLEQEERSRKDNLQYSFIFLGIIALFGIVLSLGFIKVSPNIAEGIIFFAFLILFEFILVFTDPYLEEITHEEPMYNLLANSVLALLIFPLHALLEKGLKKRIVK